MTHNEASVGEAYDVIVIGSGIGGMIAAALLAQSGQYVLVAEQHSGPGGYAHSFRRGPYTLDPAVHSIMDPAFFDALLRHLGVRDQCTFLPVDRFYSLFVDGERFAAPLTSAEEFVQAHVQWFPESAREVRAFLELCFQIHRESHDLPQRVALDEIDAVTRQFPTLFKYRNALLGEVLDEYFTSPRPRGACAAFSMLLGLPASRLPFQGYAQLLGSCLKDGMFQCQGGAEQVIRALALSLTRSGGTLLCDSLVEKIVVVEGRATGVVLADGRRFSAPVVVSNGPGPWTYERMVGLENLPPPFVRKLSRMRVADSGFVVYGATRQALPALGADHTNFVWKTWDLDEVYEVDAARGGAKGFAFFVPSALDPTLAPTGQHIFTCLTFVPYDIGRPWAEAKADFKAATLRDLDRLFPGFSDHLIFADSATPLTMERYSMNTRGSIYGWENTLAHAGSKRPAPRTPIAGLYLAGQWTQPGGGWLRSAVSGAIASRLVLADLGLQSRDTFSAPSMPPLGW